MAGDWIKMNKSLPRDPRIVRISSALKADRLRTLGGVLSAWCLFDEQTTDGKLDGYTPEILDDLVGMPGLANGMAQVGWLDICDGFIAAPRFERHNGHSAKRRAQDNDRKTSARNVETCPQTKRTKRGPEKRIEEKSNSPLPPEGECGELGLVIGETRKGDVGIFPKGWRGLSQKDKNRIKVNRNTPGMDQMATWFKRKPGSLLTIAEAAAILAIKPEQAEIDGMGRYYLADIDPEKDFRRHDLQTLLNNWSGELDRARAWDMKGNA